jgi:hypothetical protein
MDATSSPCARLKVCVRVFLVLLFCAVGLGAPPPPARAATLVVTNAHDAGPGSLRQALLDAATSPGPDTITFDAALSGETILLVAPLVVDSDVTIDGTGLEVPVALSGGGSVQVMSILSAGVTVTLRALAIVDGAAEMGGGIHHRYGALTLADCLFSGNTAADWAGAILHGSDSLTVVRSTFTGNSARNAGAVYSSGPLTVTDSTFSGNAASWGGAALYNQGPATVARSAFSANTAEYVGGAIRNSGDLTLTDSTLSGNTATHGGAIYNQVGALTAANCTFSGNAASANGGAIETYQEPWATDYETRATVTYSTFAGNAASSYGGAIHNQGTLTVTNSILAGSIGAPDCETGAPGAVAAFSHNLGGSGSCGPASAVDPLLGPLAENGGPTLTHALLAGSPAIDAADDAVCAASPVGGVDQRGAERPQGAHCDIGAFEAGAVIAPPDAVTLAATDVGLSGATLRGSVGAGNATTVVTFEYGTDTGYGSALPAAPATVAGAAATDVLLSLDGLLAETTYHYRVVAENSAGLVYGQDVSFTTTGPPVATTLPASGVSAGGAILNGRVDGRGLSADVWFEYGLDSGYGHAATAEPSPVDGSAPATVSAPLVGLLPAATYHYRVVAQGEGGTSYGEDVTFATPPTPPWAETDPARHIGEGGATLMGTVNARGTSTTVRFEYGLTADYVASVAGEPSPIVGTADVTVSAPLAGLSPGTEYHYRVVAESAMGTTYGADRAFTTTARRGVYVPQICR